MLNDASTPVLVQGGCTIGLKQIADAKSREALVAKLFASTISEYVMSGCLGALDDIVNSTGFRPLLGCWDDVNSTGLRPLLGCWDEP
jgi:hypothetical protein